MKEGGKDENEIITRNILMSSSTQPLLLLGRIKGCIPHVKIVTRIMKQ